MARSTPPGPFDVDLDKAERQALARRLRNLLAQEALDAREMAIELDVAPELLVVILRELRAEPHSRLRTTVRRGHVCWWWEPAGSKEGEPGLTGKKKGKRRQR